MTHTAEPLDPLSLPLQGERLIEASAGTGKTYTIAALYLRLLLGLGGNAAFSRPLSVEELLVVTFGKAFGVSGAAVLCSESMADYLLQFARHLIYSTAMPPAQAVALRAALGIIRSDEGQQRRDILAARIRQFREGMGEVSLGLTDSVSAIQPLIVGDNARALNLACRLRDAGCWATAIRPPTVPVGSARLRLTLTAAHHAEDINRLLEVLHGHSE